MKSEDTRQDGAARDDRTGWSRRAFIRAGLAATAALASPWPRALAAAPSFELLRLDATDMAAGVKRGDLDPVALVGASRDAIEALNPTLNAVITRFYDHALGLAEKARSDHERPFSGVPYLIKDLSDYEGFRTTFGARVFEENVSTRTAALAGAAVESGFVPLGKTNTPEYGQLPTTEPLAYGSTPNPWNLAYSSGGSSGGSAVAVASGMVPVALSSDGGGSIRIPSCHCGLFGLKVTRGRNVGANTDPLAMAVRGAVSRTVRDSAGHLVATQQKGDGAYLPPVPLVTGPSKTRLKIGLVMRGIARVDPSAEVRAVVEDTAELCRGLGHTVSDATLPDSAYDMGDALMDVSSARIAGIGAYIEKKLGRLPDERDLEPWTLQMIAEGRERKAEDVEKSRAVLMKMAADTRALVDRFDVLLMPVLSRRAVKLGELQSRPGRTFQELFDLNKQYVAYTTLFNVSGNPAMSVPLHWTEDGIPIGSHFAAPMGHEARLLELAYELEAARPWRDRHPPHSIWSA